ncbi:MAG: type II toxin-antitoxin system ParD family antitoxin [Opitutaceae bacterium]|nr:type II toxin-antitoxin system ParD family antitoxin [Opitutaceae bacterium]
MNISLTPELEKLVQAKVESGLYNNASEVIREALRDSLRRESDDDWLRAQAAIGYAQLKAGEAIPVKSKKAFVALVRSAK